jgi:hypothetical protein
MRTVLIVEDSFVESYELEYQLKELGYAPKTVATLDRAREFVRQPGDRLAAIICDNKLISGEPIATTFYAYVRSRMASTPFIVYSAFPPRALPKDDPFLAVVTKPFMDDVFKHLRLFASIIDKKRTAPSAQPNREAA